MLQTTFPSMYNGDCTILTTVRTVQSRSSTHRTIHTNQYWSHDLCLSKMSHQFVFSGTVQFRKYWTSRTPSIRKIKEALSVLHPMRDHESLHRPSIQALALEHAHSFRASAADAERLLPNWNISIAISGSMSSRQAMRAVSLQFQLGLLLVDQY